MHGSGFWGMGPWMWLVWLLILGGIVWAVYAITRQSDGTGQSEKNLTAGEILELRYARGEISTQEYEERRGTLAGI